MKNLGNEEVGGSSRHQISNICLEGHISGVPGGQRGIREYVRQEGERVKILKTHPQRHVFGVQHKEKGRKHVKHQKYAHKGMFVVSDMRKRAGNAPRGRAENVLNIKNMPL